MNDLRKYIRQVIEHQCQVPSEKYQYLSGCEPDEDDTGELEYDAPIGGIMRTPRIKRGWIGTQV